jgi:N-acyl-D-aspartate/D-glutamate deacylase
MKGSLQEGRDADIVAFDPQTITDRATEEAPSAPSIRVQHLVVAGTVVVQGGTIVAAVTPGRAVAARSGSHR